MKKTISSFALLALVATPVFAQSPSPSPVSASTPPARMIAPSGGGMHIISPEERQTLMAASKKADDDPTVKDAKAKVYDAMKGVRELMVKKDPTLAPLLEKMEAAAASPQSAGSFKPTDEEKAKLNAAHTAIKGTPEDENLRSAVVAYQMAHRNAMATDPAVAAIFSKLSAMSRPMTPAGGAPGSSAGPNGSPAPGGSPASSPVASPAASPQ